MGTKETKYALGKPKKPAETPETIKARKLGFLLGSVSAVEVAISELMKMKMQMNDMLKEFEKGKDPFKGTFPIKGGKA